MGTKARGERTSPQKKTPTFLLELPLAVEAGQAARVGAHLEAGRQFYNAVLSAGQRRLRCMRADPDWQTARAIPRTQKQERRAAFSALRERYGFSEYAFHELAKALRVTWLAEHLDAVLAQTLATRAYHALNRVCVGEARRVRFKSRGRGLSSIENKRNDTGLRFVLQKPEEGNQGMVLWKGDALLALIDWNDPVVKHGLAHRIKYARLIRRRAASRRAAGADSQGNRYSVQLALEGLPYHKPKHLVGSDTIGLAGGSSIAVVPHDGEASLSVFCETLQPDAKAMRRLQRKMNRKLRVANPEHYDAHGRIKKRGKQKLAWKSSRSYQKTRQRKATRERKLAAHRQSLHGCLVHEIVAVGNTILLEKISYKAWQKRYGRSVGLRAPGMFVDRLRRSVASTGGTLTEVPTRSTRLSQWCHGCGKTVKKPLSQRWHTCPCGVGRCSATCTLPFWLPILIRQHFSPRVPSTSFPGKVRKRACGQRTSESTNARMKGTSCPEALAVPEPERVCPEVEANLHQSLLSSSDEASWKRGRNARTPRVLTGGALSTSLSYLVQLQLVCQPRI